MKLLSAYKSIYILIKKNVYLFQKEYSDENEVVKEKVKVKD